MGRLDWVVDSFWTLRQFKAITSLTIFLDLLCGLGGCDVLVCITPSNRMRAFLEAILKMSGQRHTFPEKPYGGNLTGHNAELEGDL
jgi:hypothetical protein